MARLADLADGYMDAAGIKNMLWKTDREVGEQDYVVPLPSTELTAN